MEELQVFHLQPKLYYLVRLLQNGCMEVQLLAPLLLAQEYLVIFKQQSCVLLLLVVLAISFVLELLT